MCKQWNKFENLLVHVQVCTTDMYNLAQQQITATVAAVVMEMASGWQGLDEGRSVNRVLL